MDKELFKKTENRLYNYYIHLKLIEKLKHRVLLLWKQKEQIEKEMVELKNLNIDAYSNIGIDYSSERIQSSSSGTSKAEGEVIKYINNLDRQHKDIIKKIYNTNLKIRELELQIQDIQFNLSKLPEESKKFIELKYRDGRSVEWIANVMYGGARSTGYRKRKKLIKDILNKICY